MATVHQTAQLTGLYRCSNDGQTVQVEKGHKLEPCSCGNGTWEFLAHDNLDPDQSHAFYLGTRPFCIIETAEEEVKLGTTLNLRLDRGPYNGLYRVLEVSHKLHNGLQLPWIKRTQRIAAIDPVFPIHIPGVLVMV